MANLETLELTINSNANSASQGLNNLINSLSALSKKVGSAVGGLKRLNTELVNIQKNSGLKLGNLAKGIESGSKALRKASKDMQDAITVPDSKLAALKMKLEGTQEAMAKSANKGNKLSTANYRLQELGLQKRIDTETKALEKQTKAFEDNASATKTWAEMQIEKYNYDYSNVKTLNPKYIYPASIRQKPYSQTETGLINGMFGSGIVPSDTLTVREFSKLFKKGMAFVPGQTHSETQGYIKAITKKFGADASWKESAHQFTESGESFKEKISPDYIQKLSQAFGTLKEKLSSVGSMFSKVGRIASTMMIRSALRSLMKSFSDAWQTAYKFSASMNGEFAQSIDRIKGLLAGATSNIVNSFAPAISALLPVINVVAAAINYLASAIQWLFSLLGMSSELFGASAEALGKFGGAAGGGGKAAKEMLAAFDELNVINQESGGGGGGGGGGMKMSDIIGEEMAKIGLIASEALLALGLILAFTGHPFLGAALIALGVAGIAKTVIGDWDNLSNEIKGQLMSIMGIAGAAMLAIGLLLALTGANVPLGIGLMIAGAANLATAVALSWDLDTQVKQQISSIMGACAGGLLAIGAILAFASPAKALGIGLMVAGAVALASSVALQWGLDTSIILRIAWLTAIVGGALLALGAVIAFTGASLPLGIGLMIAGAASLASSVAINWNLDNDIKRTLSEIEAIVGASLLAVGTIVALTGANIPLGIGLMVAGVANLASAITLSWNLDKEIKMKIADILAACAGGLLAIGAILAFTGASLPLGIGLMIGGAVALGSSIALSWGLETTISEKIATLTSVLGGALLALGAVIAFTGASLPLGIGLMVAGAVSLASSAAIAWHLESDVTKAIGNIQTVIGAASLAVGAILAFTGANIPLGIGLMAVGGVALASAIAPNWEDLRTKIVNTMGSIALDIKNKWEELKGKIQEVYEKIKGFFDEIDGKILTVTIKIVASIGDAIFGTDGNSTESQIWGFLKYLIPGFASGGFPTEGSLYVANESGPELVGSLEGHSNAVANNDQIVEGIRQGVSDAQAEQNQLLREQNNLLRQLYAKETTVQIGASTAFGRVAKQSLEMYDLVGG